MNVIRRTLLLGALFLVATEHSIPQQAVPPPPKPADSGPSLEVTLKFIQDKLNDLGPISFKQSLTNSSTGVSFYEPWTERVTSVVGNAGACSISYHLKEERGPQHQVTQDGDFGISLKEAESVQIEKMEQYSDAMQQRGGSSNMAYTASTPQTWILLIHRPHNVSNYLVFQDDDLADRVAKAMTHAIELCGGGNKDPF